VSRLPQEDGALDQPQARETLAELAAQLARACNAVPASVDLGVHLCYGNAAGRHSVQPRDTAVMVAYANAFIPLLGRRLDWLHMPVPIDRDDDAYFAPLANLRLPSETRFFLGLVHPSDGIEGAKRRIAATKKVVPRFGVATECGLRFFADTDIPDILRLHREAAKLADEAAVGAAV
jgi:methionine synthase II (cobalamin-independent)